MVKHGVPPYLECSSRGDARFSAFGARVKRYGGSIESLYQARKVFAGGETGLNWRAAKGRKPLNADECAKWYAHLWDQYLWENPHLIVVLRSYAGLSDRFGQAGHCCQATELWRIRAEGVRPFPEL